jgi:copper chaperone CopZ
MSCPKCISNVDLQLARIAGVGDIAVDMKHGLVTLSVASGAEVSRDRLAAAVEDAGFTLRAIRPELAQ